MTFDDLFDLDWQSYLGICRLCRSQFRFLVPEEEARKKGLLVCIKHKDPIDLTIKHQREYNPGTLDSIREAYTKK